MAIFRPQIINIDYRFLTVIKQDIFDVQWNSIITTTRFFFLNCVVIASVVVIPVIGNKEECGVSITGKQHWLWLIMLSLKLISSVSQLH